MDTAASPDTPQTVGAVLQSATALLSQAGIATARLDAEVLLAAACATDRAALYTRWRDAVPEPAMRRFEVTLRRRGQREPLQYIIGRQEFWSLDFTVTPDVLIPRPETELLVELALSKLSPSSLSAGGTASRGLLRICDLGTGSGCIAVALARELACAEVYALDISAAALAVARLNAHRHGVEERVQFILSDGVSALRGCQFDAIVCNPPYLRSTELAEAQPELDWEPRQALDGGRSGLAVIERIVAESPAYLQEGGWLLMEIGAEQGLEAERLARAARFSTVAVVRDYAGLPRVLTACR